MIGRVYPLRPRRRRDGRIEWEETHPGSCPRGCDWTRPRTVLPSWLPCGEHRGHREWVCASKECGAVVIDPPMDETCTQPRGGPRF